VKKNLYVCQLGECVTAFEHSMRSRFELHFPELTALRQARHSRAASSSSSQSASRRIIIITRVPHFLHFKQVQGTCDWCTLAFRSTQTPFCVEGCVSSSLFFFFFFFSSHHGSVTYHHFIIKREELTAADANARRVSTWDDMSAILKRSCFHGYVPRSAAAYLQKFSDCF